MSQAGTFDLPCATQLTRLLMLLVRSVEYLKKALGGRSELPTALNSDSRLGRAERILRVSQQ